MEKLMVPARVALLAANVAVCAKAKCRGWSPENISQPDTNPLGLSPERSLEVFQRYADAALSDLSRHGHCALRGQLRLLAANVPSLGDTVIDAAPLAEVGDRNFQQAMSRLIREIVAGQVTEKILKEPETAMANT